MPRSTSRDPRPAGTRLRHGTPVTAAVGLASVASATRAPSRRRIGPARKSLRLHWQLYLLIIPPLAYFVIFKYIPMSNAVIAFKNYNPVMGIWGSPWVGMANINSVLANPVFATLVTNTFILSAYVVVASFPIPIILALALNELRQGIFKRSVQLITFAPYFISTVVVVSMTILMLSPRLGLVNRGLGFFGIGATDFMGNPNYFRHIYVWSDVWQTAGYSAVIYLATLSSIDPSQYEAAKIDGASRLRKIWHIDIPGIMPTAVIILVLAVGNIMSIGFEKAYLLQNPLNLSTSEIIATFVYKTGLLNADFSVATAVGLFNSAINLVLLLLVNAIVKRLTGGGLWS